MENIKTKNLLERLKESGLGTVLYSPVLGKVSLIGIDESKTKPIIVAWRGEIFYFTKDGKLSTDRETPVMLFFEGEYNESIPVSEEREDLKAGTAVMFSDDGTNWRCGIYKAYQMVSTGGFGIYQPRFIVPVDDFKPMGPYWLPDGKYDYGQKGTPR